MWPLLKGTRPAWGSQQTGDRLQAGKGLVKTSYQNLPLGWAACWEECEMALKQGEGSVWSDSPSPTPTDRQTQWEQGRSYCQAFERSWPVAGL